MEGRSIPPAGKLEAKASVIVFPSRPNNSEPSPSNSMFEAMVRHLEQVTVELFADYGLGIERGSASPVSGNEAVSTIGYVGERMRGALTMNASHRAIKGWMKALELTEGEADDTLGEFSNMLLGRLKGRLLPEGCAIQLATPVVTSGTRLRVSMPPGLSKTFVFTGLGSHFSVRLDAAFQAGFESGTMVAAEDVAQAGAEILF